MKKSFEKFLKLKETLFMAVLAKSRSSLQKEKCDFNNPVLKNILYSVVFSSINLPLTAIHTSEKLIAK